MSGRGSLPEWGICGPQLSDFGFQFFQGHRQRRDPPFEFHLSLRYAFARSLRGTGRATNDAGRLTSGRVLRKIGGRANADFQLANLLEQLSARGGTGSSSRVNRTGFLGGPIP
jgi:hypothetical protein